jgi:uncharacterized protein (UPF0212 family)
VLRKFGVTTTRSLKSGPVVKDAVDERDDDHSKVVTCSCGAKLEKRCRNEYVCETSVMRCPKCGAKVS